MAAEELFFIRRLQCPLTSARSHINDDLWSDRQCQTPAVRGGGGVPAADGGERHAKYAKTEELYSEQLLTTSPRPSIYPGTEAHRAQAQTHLAYTSL